MFTETTMALPSGLHLSLVNVGNPRAKTALVLIPGMGDSWRSYELVLRHLPASVRTVAFSPRGHGESDKPAHGYAVADYASDLKELLDVLGVDRAFLAGHSSASLVVRRFAHDHPERVAGLVLEGSFVSLRGHVPPEVERKMTSLTDPVPKDFVRDFTAGTFSRAPEPAFVDAMIGESMKLPARVWNETFAGLIAYDDASALPSVAAPTLVVWGAEDTLIAREMAQSLASAIPSARLAVYDGIGHTPHWEAPEQFARDVTAFVGR